MLRKGSFEGNEQAQFDQYFTQYFLKQFSTPSPDVQLLPAARHQLRNFLAYGKTGAVYNRLVQMTLKEMTKIAGDGTAHPANRINAILVLGMLKQSEPGGKPLADTFRLLQFVVKSDRFPDDMKVAAMVGLVQAAQADNMSADQKNALSALMLGIVNQDEPPGGRGLDGHNWMRRNAAQILAALGSPGPQDEVIAAYQQIIRDPAAPTTLRCELAECLGNVKFPQGAKTDFAALANLLGHQTVEICQRELDSAKDQSRDPSRRLIVYALYSALHGLEGTSGRGGLLAAADGTDGKDFVDGIRSKIKSSYTLTVDDEELPDNELGTKVSSLIADLQAILQPKPAPKPDAVAAGAPPAKEPAAGRAAADAPSAR